MQNTKYLTFEDQRVIQILWKLSTITCTLLKTIGNLSSKQDSCVMESATAKIAVFGIQRTTLLKHFTAIVLNHLIFL